VTILLHSLPAATRDTARHEPIMKPLLLMSLLRSADGLHGCATGTVGRMSSLAHSSRSQ